MSSQMLFTNGQAYHFYFYSLVKDFHSAFHWQHHIWYTTT